MHPGIKVLTEGERGCGYRQVGGLYLTGGGEWVPCGRLPIPLTTCPTCGYGVTPSRGFSWIDGDRFLGDAPKCENSAAACATCPLERVISAGVGRAGLIWVGVQFYPTASDFMEEAVRMGISRRIAAVPVDFVVGDTWVFLAHRRAIPDFTDPEEPYKPGIFQIFKPTAIEKVVTGDEPDEEIERLIERGITPVIVKHAEVDVQTDLFS